MTNWTAEQLTRIGSAEELQVASNRPDGSIRPFVTIWCVRAGDDIYIRSAYGSTNPWFRRALASGTGRIRAGGVEADVEFSQPDANVHADIDAEYHQKYDRYGPRIVGSVVGPAARGVTLRVAPRSSD
ncbi:MAG: hypothetical protein JWQ43_1724 [Glaciihabitans sp.]|nr:hypothetical protein [Glaciihabitans sp.]